MVIICGKKILPRLVIQYLVAVVLRGSHKKSLGTAYITGKNKSYKYMDYKKIIQKQGYKDKEKYKENCKCCITTKANSLQIKKITKF